MGRHFTSDRDTFTVSRAALRAFAGVAQFLLVAGAAVVIAGAGTGLPRAVEGVAVGAATLGACGCLLAGLIYATGTPAGKGH